MASNLPRADPRAASRICCEREGGGGGGEEGLRRRGTEEGTLWGGKEERGRGTGDSQA